MADQRNTPTASAKDPDAARPERSFMRELVLFYGVGALFLAAVGLLWGAGHVLLLAFASILMAILLAHATTRLQVWVGVPRGAALGLIIASAVCLFGLVGWLLAPGVAEQANQFFDALSRSLQRLQSSVEGYESLQTFIGQLPSAEAMATQTSSMLLRAGGVFSGLFGAVAGVAIVIFLGIYLAARPAPYIDGTVVLFPHAKRKRVREVLDEIDHTLAQWLAGKVLSMVVIGIVTAVGLALLDVPLALVLGILAGLLDFIPYVGPLIAGVPAVLIAFAEDPMLALYVALLFVGLQTAEGYLLLPLIERRTVSLPPALTIIMQTLLGTFFGLAGIALATPLTAVLAVLVAMLYVQDVLGDDVTLPGRTLDP